MREVGRAADWLLFEHEARYYVRVEEVVSWLSNSAAAREVLATILRDDLEAAEPLDAAS